MYCQHCRREIPDNSLFCNHCGTEQIGLSQSASPQSKYSNLNNAPNQVQPPPPYYSKPNKKTKGIKKFLKVIYRIWAIIAVVVVLLLIVSIVTEIYRNPNTLVAGIVLVLVIIAFLGGSDSWFWW